MLFGCCGVVCKCLEGLRKEQEGLDLQHGRTGKHNSSTSLPLVGEDSPREVDGIEGRCLLPPTTKTHQIFEHSDGRVAKVDKRVPLCVL